MKISVVTAGDQIYQADAFAVANTEEWSDYYVLLHDFELARYDYKPRPLFDPDDNLANSMGYPEMVPFTERKGMPLNETMQWYWFDICVLAQYHTVFGAIRWYSLTSEQRKKIAAEWGTFTDSRRFATNHAGTDANANYVAARILGEPLKSDLPKQFEVACGGNIVKAKSHEPVNRYGEPCIEVEVWNGRNPAPDALTFNWMTHPHLVHLATIATPFGYDGQPTRTGPWRVDPFPFFGGAGSPYALYFSSPNYVPLSRVRRLRKHELPIKATVP